jgi:hypothetical protein
MIHLMIISSSNILIKTIKLKNILTRDTKNSELKKFFIDSEIEFNNSSRKQSKIFSR